MNFNTGIYQIVNLVNDKRYIGSAVNLKNRKNKHFKVMTAKKHHNRYLQRSYDKYGKENFKFEILLYCSLEDLLFYEQRAIDFYDFNKELYNISPTAGSPLGVKHSKETNEKNSKRSKGNNNPFYGKKHSLETKKRISEISKKRILTERSRINIANGQKGRKHTEETKSKISKAQKGEKNHNYGKKASQKTRDKMSKTRKGRSNSTIKKPVYQIDINTNKIIQKWDGIVDAQRELSILDISKACSGKVKTAGGFKWKRVNEKRTKKGENNGEFRTS